MPFERARTLFAIGQLHRRRREKRLAREALTEALLLAELKGSTVYADEARALLGELAAAG